MQRSLPLQPGVDHEARWVKKGEQLRYGYMRYYLDGSKEGLVLKSRSQLKLCCDGLAMCYTGAFTAPIAAEKQQRPNAPPT